MTTFTRRQFLAATAATLGTATSFTHFALADTASGGSSPYKGSINKARGISFPTDAECERIKKAGYAGLELSKWDASVEEGEAALQMSRKHGLRIHSVLLGWTAVDNPNSFDESIGKITKALKTAAVYAADTVLWVPCKVGGFPNPKIGKPGNGVEMPAAWEFDIDFDPATLKVKSVVKDGNYDEYVRVQNTATEATIKAVEKLLPVAAYEGVRIGLENVWNNLWSTPKFYAALCNYFKSPWVGSYFDIGNHTMYADPVEWIKELGNENLFKLHIKGFKVSEVKGKLGGGPGDWSKIDESSIDWKAVRQTLSDINYNGWMTVEDDGRSMEEYSKVLDGIIG
ncbi:hypothetical protein FACS189443_5710 [Planctomycetales bacterium]|nr:hypothetical protein FACS189443_5710 [Planctomycetales bacterium]